MRKRGRTRLKFQPPEAGNDGFGPNPAAGAWGDGVDIGVSLTPRRGTEAETNGVVTGEQIYECEVRAAYILGAFAINTTWRATEVITGRTFNIVAVALPNDDAPRWARITLTEGQVP